MGVRTACFPLGCAAFMGRATRKDFVLQGSRVAGKLSHPHQSSPTAQGHPQALPK